MFHVLVNQVNEDQRWRDRIDQWAQEGRQGEVGVLGEQDDLRLLGEAAIAAALRPALHGAPALIVPVGNDTHNHSWVAYQVDFMQGAGKPVAVVHIPDTRGAAPPSVRHIRETRFDPKTIHRKLGT